MPAYGNRSISSEHRASHLGGADWNSWDWGAAPAAISRLGCSCGPSGNTTKTPWTFSWCQIGGSLVMMRKGTQIRKHEVSLPQVCIGSLSMRESLHPQNGMKQPRTSVCRDFKHLLTLPTVAASLLSSNITCGSGQVLEKSLFFSSWLGRAGGYKFPDLWADNKGLLGSSFNSGSMGSG